MINKITILLTFFFLSIFSFAQETNIVEGELLVLLNKEISVEYFNKELNANYPQLQLSVKKVISKRLNVWLLNYNSSNVNSDLALELVNSSANTIITQFNHTQLELRGDTCSIDSSFTDQWGMENFGQSGGVAGADIHACEAWGITTQLTTALGDTIVVAVIDDGFYLDHQDIDFFKNYSEIPNNGIDDDGNGYIDDVSGWNVYNDTHAITSRRHGTMVSGIIGAKADLVGVTGVNWGLKILPIQGSSTLESTVLESYSYVLEMRALYDSTNGAKGAYVVATNSSFGRDNANSASYPLWCAFYDSLGAYGILSATATSNSNIHVDISGDMPTTCVSDYMIAVTNTDRNDTKVTAGFGATSIDIGAPGTSIKSTAPYLGVPYSNAFSYSSGSGTSFSTPLVAGSIAFMYAAACTQFMTDYKANPSLLALEVKDIILENGDSLASLLGITTTGKRLNLYKSAVKVRTDGRCSLTSVKEILASNAELEVYPNPNNGEFNLKLTDFELGEYQMEIYDITGKLVTAKQLIVNSDEALIQINQESQMDKGMYVLCLKSNLLPTKNIRFIVQ
jgi:serine protease